MRSVFFFLSALFLLVFPASPSTAGQPAGTGPEAEIAATVSALLDAQTGFDAERMDRLLAADYVEISPVGEVDPRSKVLGFYAPDKKPAATAIPVTVLDELSTRLHGETAVTIARVSFQAPGAPPGSPARAMRAVFVTRLDAGQWRIVSSQYTPMRVK